MAERDPLAGYPAMMTIAQVAEATQLSVRTLYNRRQDGDGPTWRKVGGSVRYPREALREYMTGGPDRLITAVGR